MIMNQGGSTETMSAVNSSSLEVISHFFCFFFFKVFFLIGKKIYWVLLYGFHFFFPLFIVLPQYEIDSLEMDWKFAFLGMIRKNLEDDGF